MGTWGPHSFENDTASDLLDQLRHLDQPVEQAEVVRENLQSVIVPSGTYLDADDVWAAVAAAEVVAGALGQSHSSVSETFALEASFKFYDDTVGMALSALDHVQERPCELVELWAESEDAGLFYSSVGNLRERLNQAAKSHGLTLVFDLPEPVQKQEDTLRTEVEQVYDDMMSEIERIANSGAGDPQVEVLRHLVRKMNLIHKDITNMRYFVVDSLEALTDRIDGLEKKL